MSQRVATIGIVIVAVILTLFAFTKQQGAATNEATAIANAYAAGTAQFEAEAAQQTAFFQMDTHATAQSQAEATRAAADLAAQQAAATVKAAVTQAAKQAALAETAQTGATQQALQAETAQAGATQQAQVAAQAQTEAAEQAVTATAAAQEAILLDATANALQAEVTTQSNQAATKQNLATAGAATAQKAQVQINQLVAHSTNEAVSVQQTLSALESQLAVPVAPQEVIQFLVQQRIIEENTGKLGSRLGKTTIDMTGKVNRSEWTYLPGRYGDFVIAADINWGAFSPYDQCDFIVRHLDDNNHYRVGINRSGQVHFDTFINGEWDEKEPYTDMRSLIQTEQSDSNKMIVIGLGDSFTVYINGQLAITYRDARFTEGQVAIEAATDVGNRGAGCTFQNTWVWDLPSQVSKPTSLPLVSSTPIPVPNLLNEYTTTDNKLSVNYPLDWKATEVGSSTILYSKDFTQLGATKTKPGEMTVIISVISSQNGNQPDLDFTLEYLTGFFSGSFSAQQPLIFSETESLSLPGRMIRRRIATSSLSDVQFWVYRDQEAIISITIACAPGEGRTCEPIATAIVKTIVYNPAGKND